MSRQTLTAIFVGIVIIVILSFYIFGLTDSFTTNNSSQVATVSPTEKLKVEDLKVGSGSAAVKSGDTVVINYVGKLASNNKVFDSSYDRHQPFETKIGVGEVIKGWDEGVVGMKVGGKRRLTIPPSFGYGEQGAGDTIPPNSTLVFDVELVAIK